MTLTEACALLSIDMNTLRARLEQNGIHPHGHGDAWGEQLERIVRRWQREAKRDAI